MVEVAVVILPGLVVVVAEEVDCGLGNSGGEEDVKLDEACGSAVAVAERVDPGEIDVGDDGLQDGERKCVAVVGFEVIAVEP